MSLQYNSTVRNGMLDDLTSKVGGSCYLRFYSGSKPANCAASLGAAVLLAELICSNPFAPGASAGVLTVSSIAEDASADNTGTCSFFRLYKSDGTTCVIQGDVGTSGADINFPTTSFVAGAKVQMTSWTITAPGA